MCVLVHFTLYLSVWPVILGKDGIIRVHCTICHQHNGLTTITTPSSLIELGREGERERETKHISEGSLISRTYQWSVHLKINITSDHLETQDILCLFVRMCVVYLVVHKMRTWQISSLTHQEACLLSFRMIGWFPYYPYHTQMNFVHDIVSFPVWMEHARVYLCLTYVCYLRPWEDWRPQSKLRLTYRCLEQTACPNGLGNAANIKVSVKNIV